MNLFVEIVPTTERHDWESFEPGGAAIGRVLKTPPKDWSTKGYWRVLDIDIDWSRFSDYTAVPV